MDYISEKSFICRAKPILSSLYGDILWSTFPSSMQVSKQCYWPTSSHGLKTLIHPRQPTHQPFIIKRSLSSSLPSSLPVSPPSPLISSASSSLLRSPTDPSPYCSCSSMLDDLIGTESGVYLNSSTDHQAAKMEANVCDHHTNHGKRNHQRQQCEMRKKYPPTIPSLARTGNLLGHMPWILTRHYSNGRLILREERLEHHEYFESYRQNGHLILKLIPVDDEVRCCHPANDEEAEEEDEKYLELELQDLEEEQKRTHEILEKDEDEEVDIYEELMHEKSRASSVPKSYLKNGSDRHVDICKSFTYAGDGCMAQSVSSETTLTFTIHPITTVV